MWTRAATIVGAALAVGANAESFAGDMTAYTLGQTSAGNCNFMHAAPQATTNYAALNDPQWAGTKNCGRCALVSCSDARCADKAKTELVYILDRCPECKYGDLDVSPSVFKSLTGSDPSRYKISWSFVDCPVTGNIKYCLKGGSNPFWTAIQPANTVTGVAGLTINTKNTGMVTSAYYYLLDGQSATQTDLSSVKVTLTSVSGEVIQETVSLTAGACTDGSRQFSRGTVPSPPAPAPVNTPAPTAAPTPAPVTKTPVTPTTPATTKPSASQSTADNSTVAGDADADPSANASAGEDANAAETDDTDEPGVVKPGDASQVSSKDAEQRAGLEESGVLAGGSASTDASGSGVTEATTRAEAGTSTSPAVIVLTVLAAVGMVTLAVVAAMVKRKKLMDKDADRDDSLMIVNLGSFDMVPETSTGVQQSQRLQQQAPPPRQDFAVL